MIKIFGFIEKFLFLKIFIYIIQSTLKDFFYHSERSKSE